MWVTFCTGLIFYERWLVTFTRWDGGRKTFECTAAWINYAGDGSWDATGFNPVTAHWIHPCVLCEVEQWLRTLPGILLPQLPALMPPALPSIKQVP
jgi:hypothetical protein